MVWASRIWMPICFLTIRVSDLSSNGIQIDDNHLNTEDSFIRQLLVCYLDPHCIPNKLPFLCCATNYTVYNRDLNT